MSALRTRRGGRGEATHDAHVAVDGCYPLVGALLEELAADDLLESEDNTVLAANADCRASILYRLLGIFDLWNCELAVAPGASCRVDGTWKLRPSGEKTELERS